MLNCLKLTALQSTFVCKKSFLGPFPAFSESLVVYLTLMVYILNIKLMNRNYNKLSYWIVFRECFSSLPRVFDGGDLYPVPLAWAGWSQGEADGQCPAGPSAPALALWGLEGWRVRNPSAGCGPGLLTVPFSAGERWRRLLMCKQHLHFLTVAKLHLKWDKF